MSWFEEYFTCELMKFRDVQAMEEKTPGEVDFLEKALQIRQRVKFGLVIGDIASRSAKRHSAAAQSLHARTKTQTPQKIQKALS